MKRLIAILTAGLALASPAAALSSSAAPGAYQVAAQTATASAISGRVVDARKNDPLAGVKVTAYRVGSTVADATAMTDAQGQFTLNGLRGGDYRLLFERAGYPKSLAAGIGVKPHDHLVLVAAFALQSKTKLEQARIADPCSSLLQPGQVADVYVICSGH
ncbi:MAG TPA: carboxypeptidase-like regulatory domain-containing protein [Candidatus Eremiobacteraceae bacterium]